MNPHVDAVPLAHAGRTATIRMSWRARQVIRREWGEDWQSRLTKSLDAENEADMAQIVAIASGMSVADVLDWSPPTAICAQLIYDAYQISRMGGTSPNADQEAKGGENPLLARSMISKLFALWPFKLVSAGLSSGNKPPTQQASS